MNRFVWIALAGALAYWASSRGGPDPQLVDGSYQYPGYEIQHLEPFSIEARVLARKDYRTDRAADLSKTDLALGWGPMSRPDIIAQLDISQSGRWYRWQTDEMPIERRAIETHSANMHMVAATPEVAEILEDVKEGQMIRIQGQLIEARAEDGWRWRSSLTRNDTGNGACEVVWLQRVSVI